MHGKHILGDRSPSPEQVDSAASLAASPGALRRRIGLLLGPVVACLILMVGAPDSLIALSDSAEAASTAWHLFAIMSLMVIWWVTEAIPIAVTALIPIVAFPLFGIQTIKNTSAEYMHPVVVLLMGGFMVAKVIERWNLHERIALNVIGRVGSRPSMLIAGFMAAAAIMSMWISNSATSIMLTPIALSVAAAMYNDNHLGKPFTLALVIGIAHSCSIGGLGTPVGTPTNLIVIGYLEDVSNISISFTQWMAIGVPTVCILLPLAWLSLTRVAFNLKIDDASAGQSVIAERLSALGRLTTPERRTLFVFATIAGLWVFRSFLTSLSVSDVLVFDSMREFVGDAIGFQKLSIEPLSGLTDHMTAIIGVILCFLIPAGSKTMPNERLLNWSSAESIPWGPLLLFGGGLSLAAAIRLTGLGTWFGEGLAGLSGIHIVILISIITALVVFMTEVLSNVATAASLMPVLGAAAVAVGIDVELMAVPIALAASCAFMLPMATGPNAVIYASGAVSLPSMAKAGLWLNCIAIPVIVLVTLTLGKLVL